MTIIKENRSIFSTGEDDIGCTDVIEHDIITTDEIPIKQPDRRIPPQLQPEVRKHLQKWLKQGVIRESTSPYGQQLVIVKKKSGDIRLCVDFRLLNEKCPKDSYPLPRVQELLDALKGAKYFSVMDLISGYLQLPLSERSKFKTAFRALGQLFEFERMPFEVCNGPATFSRLMSKCFGDLNLIWLIIFLDDLLVYSKTIDEMLDRVAVVFGRLKKYGLKIKPNKVHLFQKEVCHLGYHISEKGISTDPEKVSAITEWGIPDNDKDLHSFLGLASYYRRFVKDFAKIAKPLYGILNVNRSKKKVRTTQQDRRTFKDKWTPTCTEAFQILKHKLTSAPVLGFPDFELPFILEVDSSLDGIGAVLSQKQEGRKVVLAYASRSLKESQQNMKNYSSMRPELLGLRWAVTEKFKDYLYGSRCIVYTDNNPLSHLTTSKAAPVTDMRSIAQLADYNLDIHYKPGRNNQNADVLSRHPNFKKGVVTHEQLVKVVSSLTQSTFIPSGIKSQVEHVVVANCNRQGATTEVHKSTSLPGLQKEDIRRLQSEDGDISIFLPILDKGEKLPSSKIKTLPIGVKTLYNNRKYMKMEDGVLYRIVHRHGTEIKQLVLPAILKNRVLTSLHDECGHQGVERTFELVRTRCFWPSLFKDVTNY